MRSSDYIGSGRTLLAPHTTSLFAVIHEAKGCQSIQTTVRSDILGTLTAIVRIQSTDASNRIEGVSASNNRLNDLVSEKATPRNHNEEETAGCRDALSAIHESHDYIPIIPNVTLQLHRGLFRHTPLTFVGHSKDNNSVIIERDTHRISTVRFVLSPTLVTLESIGYVCPVYTQTIWDGHTNPLLAIAMFVLDFICTRPFNDDNGRMNWLFTPLTLYHNDCMVGKYINIEHLIEQSKNIYYEALAANIQDWDDSANDYAPFTNYLFDIMLSACKEFDERINLMAGSRVQGAPWVTTKGTWIGALLDQSLVPLSKADILARISDTSTTTIERTPKSLSDSGVIIKIGAGRSTRYVKCR